MHWIEAWRNAYINPKSGRKGLTREEFAAMVRNKRTGCSEVLIAIIENGGITHPKIANRIAKVTGATCEQRDSLVSKEHRDTKPDRKRRDPEDDMRGDNANTALHPVVQLNTNGEIAAEYGSIRSAAAAMECSVGAIENRCRRRLRHTDEFLPFGFTFRYADEWRQMDEKARMDDIRQKEGA